MSEAVFMDEIEEAIFYLENTEASRRMLRKSFAKQLNCILKLGHIPNRSEQKYGNLAGLVNCFEYACFNLTNEEIETLGLDEFKYSYASPFGAFDLSSIESAKADMVDLLQQSGYVVEFEKEPKILKSNQHRVALYFTEGFTKENRDKDFHLLLQGLDGTWSGKESANSDRVEYFDKLEESLPHDVGNRYILDSVMVLTNPYAPAEERQR